jgi:hypothetical protein
MVIFDCQCGYRFIIGKKQVYGPIFAHNLPGHFTGDPGGCYSRGQLMTCEQFRDHYADCAGSSVRLLADPHARCVVGEPCKVRS